MEEEWVTVGNGYGRQWKAKTERKKEDSERKDKLGGIREGKERGRRNIHEKRGKEREGARKERSKVTK